MLQNFRKALSLQMNVNSYILFSYFIYKQYEWLNLTVPVRSTVLVRQTGCYIFPKYTTAKQIMDDDTRAIRSICKAMSAHLGWMYKTMNNHRQYSCDCGCMMQLLDDLHNLFVYVFTM